MAKKPPIDPLTGPTMILEGRIVTMATSRLVISRGRLYIKGGTLVRVQPASAPAPDGFDGVAVTNTKGTIYPGLIELHNHLAYNALRLWQVPRTYTNRDQWAGIPEYRERVSGPMNVVGKTPDLLPAVIRFVETKCLVAGVTTTQGVALFSNAGVRRYYRGVVRNVEQTDEAALPEAATRIADVDGKTPRQFLERLKKQSCFLLHLSEGKDATARKHFQALRIDDTSWAILPELAGIHAAGLTTEDMQIYGTNGGAMIWSPLSNLLLYGGTADVAAAKANGVRIGLGSDWSPSGSKNLLGELKVAKVFSDNGGGIFSSEEIVAMATRTGAQILKWDGVLGSLEDGKRADLLVVEGTGGDPFDHLIEAKEQDVSLVIINGVPRFGTAALMKALGVTTAETVKVGSASRKLFLRQDEADPQVGKISLSDSIGILEEALATLPALALELEKPKTARTIARELARGPIWELALDELQESGTAVRARMRLGGEMVGARALAGRGSKPLSQIVKPLVLDRLTVADDADFVPGLGTQKNLPGWLKSGLASLLS
jgi:5-methylthioadenosine/S-adenosylhomocysteine deaminase